MQSSNYQQRPTKNESLYDTVKSNVRPALRPYLQQSDLINIIRGILVYMVEHDTLFVEDILKDDNNE